MREFTFHAFKTILEIMRDNGYSFIRFEDYLTINAKKKFVILRHDVDRYPKNALKIARMEHEMGIRSTYFFRTIPSVFKPEIMKMIASLGHEVAYHYEDLSKTGGNRSKAIKLFESNLNKIREIYPAKTICMHGSPLSKWDNKSIWEDYNYREYGIIGDTSLDIDYDTVFYITDNGWGWNNKASSVRDKVDSRFNIPIRDTGHFLDLIKSGELPDQILFNTHPDSFFDQYLFWLMNKTIILSKNLIKKQIVKYKIFK